MVPTLDLLIGGAIRAMTEVVAPAIPAEQGVAAEQARMVIGILSLVQQRVGFEGARSLKEMEIALDMAGRLVPVLSNPGKLQAELENAHRGIKEAMNDKQRDALRRTLLAGVAAAIDDESNGEARDRLLRIVLDASARQISLTRTWSLPSGFETELSDADPLFTLTE